MANGNRQRGVGKTENRQQGDRTAMPSNGASQRNAPVSRRSGSQAFTATKGKPKRFPVLPAAAAIAAIAIVVVVLRIFSSAMSIDITVNGNAYTIHGAKTLQTAIKESGLPVNPGDLISIRGLVIKKSAGNPFTATVNGEAVTDPNYALHNNDEVTIADGKDVVEDYDSTEEYIPHSAFIDGAGAIHLFTAGSDGVREIRTGSVSGEVMELQKTDPQDAVCIKYNPEVGEDKVIALTFDEGPSEEYTGQILDILEENDAHATFFCVGTEIEKYNDSLVKRERDEGHQVCTGTYDHARSGDGVSASSINVDELAQQVEHGREVISKALGNEEASRVVRLPGGQLDEDMVRALDEYVEVEVGWNVDTGDWADSSEDQIYRVLTSLEKGDIVLCHDGGGDRSKTVEALRRALPKLREAGFSFVTIDDLLEYPSQ